MKLNHIGKNTEFWAAYDYDMKLTSAKLTTNNPAPFYISCGMDNTIEILSSLTSLSLGH